MTEAKPREGEDVRLSEELSRAVLLSEMFVGILSHELRNPLSAILAGAQILGQDIPRVRAIRVLARISASGARMGRMIEQLMDFTRARLGNGIPLDRSALDLAQLAHGVVDEARAESPASVLRLTTDGDALSACDRERVIQVLSNLVGNALQHGDPSGAIEVAVDGADAAYVVVTVQNQGAIPPHLVPVVFSPFRGALHERGAATSQGLGLGLYVARQIALAHGGELSVQCTDVRTTFTLRLPRAASGAAGARPDLARDEEVAAFERMAAPPGSSAVTAQLYGASSLQERMPIEHADIVARYGALLDTALARKAYRGQGDGLAAELRALGDRLGDLGAGPREVTDVHARALRNAVRGATSAKSQALLAEGRLLALELMGNLASYYRRRSRGQGPAGEDRT
ncbi:MAG: HAMP domain-containing sensor histidine kinase [Deltaproteobacteria bacterium]|nr:HAMP domain-containing sensor histidine kinase [Myxococcales bacterium]MDP3221285.1 HAMP domain-containing sensor histidine kinase [Deltaproteobacteria bacterium]